MDFSLKWKKILVTGCTGLIGSWLTEKLVSEGAIVYGLIYETSKNDFSKEVLEKVIFLQGNILNLDFLNEILLKFNIEIIFHTAAQTQVLIAQQHPLLTFKTNIEGTWNILEAARTTTPNPLVIIASSDKAYGIQKTLPYTEDASLQGSFPYDVSKSCVDLLSQAYFKTFGLPVCITRCGNVYGGRDTNFARIVPGMILSLLRNERLVLRSNGKFKRDYNYVENIADGYILLAKKMIKDTSIYGEAFNLSNNDPKTVMQIVNAVCDLMGKKNVKPQILNQAKAEIPNQYLDATKAEKILGWKPNFTFREGLIKTIEWYKHYFEEGQ